MIVTKYHYCAMRNRLNAEQEYRSGAICSAENISSTSGYNSLKAAIGAKEEPHWSAQDIVLISLS